MTQIPNCCTPSSSVRTAATILKQFALGALPVIDDYASRKLVGIITDRDLCIGVLVDPDRPSEALVEDCMTRDPVCCSPDSDVRYVLALMASHGVRRIPVVAQDHRVVGMVTLTDLVHQNALPPQDLCSALACIVAPAKQIARACAVAAGTK
jgi:CBS-domain-containing membrane protein